MNQNIDTFFKVGCNLKCAIQDQEHKIVPFWIRKCREEFTVLAINRLNNLIVGLSDCMNVRDVQKLDPAVCIIFRWLITFSRYFVSQCGHVSSCVVNYAVCLLDWVTLKFYIDRIITFSCKFWISNDA
jgi:hypothetical protein